MIDDVESALGPIDIYVANTGGPPGGPDPLGFTGASGRRRTARSILSPMAFLERLLPAMRTRGWGRVVAVGSMSVREPIAALQLSNAHRPGLVAAFKVLARQAAADGVTLNTVLPGRIATDRIFGSYGSREAAESAAEREVPAGRLGTVEELAAAAVFLCSDAAGYVTGTTLLVDGGLTASVCAPRLRLRRAVSSIGRARDFWEGALAGRPLVRRRLFAGTPLEPWVPGPPGENPTGLGDQQATPRSRESPQRPYAAHPNGLGRG